MINLEGIFTIEGLISLLTLSVLEIVLGIDNIIFISIVSDRLPEPQQQKARVTGLSLALIMRVILLFSIAYLSKLTTGLFTVFDFELTTRDLIMFFGGLFLLAKSTTEIHSKISGGEHEQALKAKAYTLGQAIFQIILLDIVFSFDSILTAVGLVENVLIMVTAVIIAMIVMLLFAGVVSRFVNTHPTIKMLALSFLLMIGLLLILDAFHVHVPKGYVYFAMAFSLFVEFLNLRAGKKKNQVS